MTDTTHPGLSRRRFLACGTAVAAAPLAGRLHAAAGLRVREAGAIRVGYVPASAGRAGLEDLYLRQEPGAPGVSERAGILPASRASSGVSPREWVLTLQGLQPSGTGSSAGSVSLDVLYRNDGFPGGVLPFRAWQGFPAAGERPTALRFKLPADVLEGFAVTAGGGRGFRAALSRAVGRARRSEAGFAAAPGLYLVALPDGRGRPVDWERHRVALATRNGGVHGARLLDASGRDAGHDCLFVTLTPA